MFLYVSLEKCFIFFSYKGRKSKCETKIWYICFKTYLITMHSHSRSQSNKIKFLFEETKLRWLSQFLLCSVFQYSALRSKCVIGKQWFDSYFISFQFQRKKFDSGTKVFSRIVQMAYSLSRASSKSTPSSFQTETPPNSHLLCSEYSTKIT